MEHRAPFSGSLPTTTDIVSVTNNGDGTYHVTFDAVATVAAPNSLEIGMAFYSPSLQAWVIGETTIAGANMSINLTADGLDSGFGSNPNDCTKFAILDTPVNMSAPNPFNLMQGFVAIT